MIEKAKLKIDKKEFEAIKGENLLQIARKNEFKILGLCFYEKNK